MKYKIYYYINLSFYFEDYVINWFYKNYNFNYLLIVISLKF